MFSSRILRIALNTYGRKHNQRISFIFHFRHTNLMQTYNSMNFNPLLPLGPFGSGPCPCNAMCQLAFGRARLYCGRVECRRLQHHLQYRKHCKILSARTTGRTSIICSGTSTYRPLAHMTRGNSLHKGHSTQPRDRIGTSSPSVRMTMHPGRWPFQNR